MIFLKSVVVAARSSKNHLQLFLVVCWHATPHVRLRDWLIDNISLHELYFASVENLCVLRQHLQFENHACRLGFTTKLFIRSFRIITKNSHHTASTWIRHIVSNGWDAVWNFLGISFSGLALTHHRESTMFSLCITGEDLRCVNWLDWHVSLVQKTCTEKENCFSKILIDDFDPFRKWRGAGKETTDIESASSTIGTSTHSAAILNPKFQHECKMLLFQMQLDQPILSCDSYNLIWFLSLSMILISKKFRFEIDYVVLWIWNPVSCRGGKYSLASTLHFLFIIFLWRDFDLLLSHYFQTCFTFQYFLRSRGADTRMIVPLTSTDTAKS